MRRTLKPALGDAAYLDAGWFVDHVRLACAAGTVASESGAFLSDGTQNNDWSVRLLSKCDLTPGVTSTREAFVSTDGYDVHRFSGADIYQSFTKCSTQDSFTAVISNLPTGDLDVLDAPYTFRITNTGARGRKADPGEVTR